jgi:hypothetical protein
LVLTLRRLDCQFCKKWLKIIILNKKDRLESGVKKNVHVKSKTINSLSQGEQFILGAFSMKYPLVALKKARYKLIDCRKRFEANPNALNNIRLRMAEVEYEAAGGKRNGQG